MPLTGPLSNVPLQDATLSHTFTINHSARLYMGYRWYDEQKIHPQFCFGF